MSWDEDEANNDVFVYDLPDYPNDFTPQQRLEAYWQMIRSRRKPVTTKDWRGFLQTAESSAQTRELIIAGVRAERADRPAQPGAQRPTLTGQGDALIKEARAELERAQDDETRWRKAREHTSTPAETDLIEPDGDDLV